MYCLQLLAQGQRSSDERRSNGLRREASITAILTSAPRPFISPRIVETKAILQNVRFRPDLSIDWDDIGLSAGLNAKAVEEN
jgi:hypothetical protein